MWNITIFYLTILWNMKYAYLDRNIHMVSATLCFCNAPFSFLSSDTSTPSISSSSSAVPSSFLVSTGLRAQKLVLSRPRVSSTPPRKKKVSTALMPLNTICIAQSVVS